MPKWSTQISNTITGRGNFSASLLIRLSFVIFCVIQTFLRSTIFTILLVTQSHRRNVTYIMECFFIKQRTACPNLRSTSDSQSRISKLPLRTSRLLVSYALVATTLPGLHSMYRASHPHSCNYTSHKLPFYLSYCHLDHFDGRGRIQR